MNILSGKKCINNIIRGGMVILGTCIGNVFDILRTVLSELKKNINNYNEKSTKKLFSDCIYINTVK